MFGMMHFLSVFFAPRIKELSTLELYSFVSQKEYAQQGYVLLPHHFSGTQTDELVCQTASLAEGVQGVW